MTEGKARPVSGEIMTASPGGAGGPGHGGDVIDADFEIVADGPQPVRPESRVAPPVRAPA